MIDNLVCENCGHFFDPDDRRCTNPKRLKDLGIESRDGPKCPACTLEEHIGSEAWALWNSCQGVFTCSVFDTRKECQDLLAKYGSDGDRVVPVRVFKERDDRLWLRSDMEDESEKYDIDKALAAARRLTP